MEKSTSAALASDATAVLDTTKEQDPKNPYRSNGQVEDPGKEVTSNILPTVDTEKVPLDSDEKSASINSPIPVESEYPTQSPISPLQEADKEVLSSWQSKSQGESGAIPMAYHESRSPTGGFMNDIKGPPPSYDSLVPQDSARSDSLIASPSSLEPDGGSNLPPRPEDRSAVGQLLSWIPPAPVQLSNRTASLIQPVIVPQIDVPPDGESVPFARCYSDALALHNISMRDFTAFLDGLALAQAPNSALQGLKMFGVGVSSVPLPFIPLAGKGIKALASTGSGHSSSRARLYIERARKEYFEPRGLRLTIVKDQDLSPRLQIPSHAQRLGALTKNTLTQSLRERRQDGLAPYVSPLRYDVPEQDVRTRGVHKLAQKHLEQKFQQRSRRLAKLREQQWQDITLTHGQYYAWDERYAAKMAELRRTQLDLIQYQSRVGLHEEQPDAMREFMDALWRDQRELQILHTEREMALGNLSSATKGVEAEIKEVGWTRGLKWICIENLQ